MKIKILKDFDYSFDGIRPVSFKAGGTTENFTNGVIYKLEKRGLVALIRASTDKDIIDGEKAAEIKAAEIKAAEEKAEEIKAAEIKAAEIKAAEKFKGRKAEILKAGAELVDGQFKVASIKVSEKDLLEPNDKEWSEFITNLIETVATVKKEAEEKAAEEQKAKDDLLGLGNEPEKGTKKTDAKKTTQKTSNKKK